jgi:hypothetical protein
MQSCVTDNVRFAECQLGSMMKLANLGVATLCAVVMTALTPGSWVRARAEPIVVGTDNADTCVPFGCTGWLPVYQQLYSASAFGGSDLSINEITFYRNTSVNGSYSPQAGTFTISLSTSPASVVGGLDSNPNNNLGADNTVVFNGSLPALTNNNELDVFLSTSFLYNSNSGNLLLNVTATNTLPSQGLPLYFATQSPTGPMMSSFFNSSSGPRGTTALVTGFDTVSPTPLHPLPFYATGPAALALLLWFRKRKAPASPV